MEGAYTLLAVADGNSSFCLAQAIVILTTGLRVVRDVNEDHNIYLPGSLRVRERMLSDTDPAEKNKFPSLSPLVS